MRRNRRKFAAQLLDEQLSRDIDKALSNVNSNFPPVPTIAAPPDPPKASITFTWPSWTESPPTPPQLPLLDFGNLDFGEFPCITPGKQRLPLTPPTKLPDVPYWCPYIPSLMQTGAGWTGDMPRFTDLSSLSERDSPPKYDSLQLRPDKGKSPVMPKKQSRFFPTLTTSVSAPVVKLPPTQCKLHRTEQEVQDSMRYASWEDTESTTPPQYFDQHAPYVEASTSAAAQYAIADMWPETVLSEPAPYFNHNVSHVDQSPKAASNFEQSQESAEDTSQPLSSSRLASAANLWRILNEDSILPDERVMETRREVQREIHNLRSSWDDSEDSGGVPIYQSEYQPPIAELDSTEIPYVHLNSLTGHSNETAEYHTPAEFDSVLYLADFFATPRSITPACEMNDTPSSYTPSSPCLHKLEAGELSTANMDRSKARPEISDEMKQSEEHFNSEQELFKPEEVLLPVSRPRTPCDLATFLAMGHVENCWCRDCNELPELIEKEELQSDNDDDWLEWSTLGDETDEDDKRAPQTATVTDVSDEDDCFPCASAPEWDELYPYTSGSQQEADRDFQESREFLGYYDDGAAFAQDNEYEGWWTGC